MITPAGGVMLIMLAALALGAGCGAPQRKKAPPGAEPHTGRSVRRVAIDGNRAFRDSAIVAKLAHRPRSGRFFRSYTHYDPLKLRVDRRRVEAYYQERGYFAARVLKVEAKPVGEEEMDIAFVVEEGEPTRISSREISGVDDELAAELMVVLDRRKFAEGQVFDHNVYGEIKSELTAALVSRGFAHAAVKGRVRVDREALTAAVEFELIPGPTVRYGGVEITGNERIPTRSIRARVAWRRGEVFASKDLKRTRENLSTLGAFSSVRIDYPKDPPAAVAEMRLRVKEVPANEIKAGGGFEADPSRFEVRARLGYSRHGFLDRLTAFRATVRPGYVLYSSSDTDQEATLEGNVGLQRIDLIWPRLSASAAMTIEREAVEAYTSFGAGGRISINRTFLRGRLRLSAGWRFRYLFSVDLDPAVVPDPPGDPDAGLVVSVPYRLGYIAQEMTLDFRDDRFFPRRGVYAEVHADEGGGYAGGALDYLRAWAEIRGYVPVTRRLVVAGRMRLGGLVADGEEPITERFYSGGVGHRGFDRRLLSPSIGGVVVGGAGLLESSIEARLRLTTYGGQPLRLVGFVDGGQVTTAFDQLDPSSLEWAVGFGFRFDLPVAPLRLDAGYHLDSAASFLNRWTVHLGIGDAF